MKKMLIIWILVLMPISVIIHESGHYIPAKVLDCDPIFKLSNDGPDMMTNNCSNPKELMIGISGIFLGLVYLLLMMLYFSPDRYILREITIINIGILFGYMASSIPDMIRIIKIISQL